MFNYRKFADKAQPAITNVGTAFSFASFPWSNAYTVVVALTSVVWATVIAVWAATIGSMPAWASPMFGLIAMLALTGSMLLLVRKKVVYVASQYKQLDRDNQTLRHALKNATGSQRGQ